MRFLTVTEAARQLNYSQRRTRELLKMGALPGKKLGRKWLISQAEVNRLLGDVNGGFAGGVPGEVHQFEGVLPQVKGEPVSKGDGGPFQLISLEQRSRVPGSGVTEGV